MLMLNRFSVLYFTLLFALATTVQVPIAAQTPTPAGGADAAQTPALGPRIMPPPRSALNPAEWRVGPDGKRYAPIPEREKAPSPLPDLKPEQPLITVGGRFLGGGTCRDCWSRRCIPPVLRRRSSEAAVCDAPSLPLGAITS